MSLISIVLNGKEHKVKKGSTILDAAKSMGIHIDTLCHHEDLCLSGVCRICVVEVEGSNALMAACSTPVVEGMKIKTHSSRVRRARKNILELLIANHYGDCYTCSKNQKCTLQKLANEYSIEESLFGHKDKPSTEIDESSFSIVRDKNKCILCKRCIRTCQDLQGVGAFSLTNKGSDETCVDTFWGSPMLKTACINCGQCINRCPTGALREKSDVEKIWQAIDDPNIHVVIQTAPAPRIAIGEEFGLDPGTILTKELNTAIKMVGFDKVFDTNFAADLTVIEEGTELLMRLKKTITGEDVINNSTIPMITSCSPGWVKYCEEYFSDQLDHLSTCKSPQQMFGALIKTYYAKKAEVDPSKILSVSLMPCTAKKFECGRPEMNASGYRDVDISITTRELAQMIKQSGINLVDCEKSEFDDPIGIGTGAGMVFGATGGVTEAAIRTIYEIVTGREVPFKNLEIKPVRGLKGVREAELKFENVLDNWSFLEGITAKVAIAHGTANAKKVMDAVRDGRAPWHFIEVMACPGGCLGGGGMPTPTNDDIRKKRAKAVYNEDRGMPMRKSHENPQVKKLYEEFLIEPLGKKSHELLHTSYKKRGPKMRQKK